MDQDTPALPPEIREQMIAQSAPQPQPQPQVFAQAGQQPQAAGAGNPIGVLKQKLSEFEKVVGEVYQILQTVHPPALALMQPIAQSGKAIMQEIAQMEKRQAGGASPQPSPQPNPAEGVPARPM